MNSKQQAEFEAWAKGRGMTLHKASPCDGSPPYYLDTASIAARGSYQAALESPEVQALRNDAERYRKLVADWFDHVHGREFGLINDMPPEAYESKADVDAAIDAAREK